MDKHQGMVLLQAYCDQYSKHYHDYQVNRIGALPHKGFISTCTYLTICHLSFYHKYRSFERQSINFESIYNAQSENKHFY